MKLERLISIIFKLLNHEVLSAAKLAEEFQVSQRTIYRDIDAICAAGFPVVSHQGTNGGYGIMDGYKMDKSLLGSYDVNSLITVLQSLSTVFEDTRAQGTIERLQTIGPEHRTTSLSVDLDTRRTDLGVLPLLRTAISQRNIIRFDYISAQNERTTREMEPVRLHFKFGNWYIYGYCRTRRDYREFRLSRMLHLTLTPNTFHPHHNLPEDTGSAKKAWDGQVEEVVLQVRPEALADVMDQFHQAEKQFHADGSMTVRIPVYRPLEARWLWSILLSFGSGAEVLEPVPLRDILKEQLQQALKLYEEV
ncbi:YafY family transcriptional regulator [Paenibacillus sp. alder61]|uniref:YafY family transcriptional regulator n=1 Tax=Paenibacillus faecis TaxID=862114 RepID=A0A5D0CUG1_9BACL|nr:MULTISPECIES: YafY family protein [Paenibacillus]MCA1291947.1 YafY family transcriptional regulator [Paenibacillus sp. alder61]TYA13529.1 YafY family transcriptional regulator [Paenibacillus faecis]